jgi:hypothetical protein
MVIVDQLTVAWMDAISPVQIFVLAVHDALSSYEVL